MDINSNAVIKKQTKQLEIARQARQTRHTARIAGQLILLVISTPVITD